MRSAQVQCNCAIITGNGSPSTPLNFVVLQSSSQLQYDCIVRLLLPVEATDGSVVFSCQRDDLQGRRNRSGRSGHGRTNFLAKLYNFTRSHDFLFNTMLVLTSNSTWRILYVANLMFHPMCVALKFNRITTVLTGQSSSQNNHCDCKISQTR